MAKSTDMDKLTTLERVAIALQIGGTVITLIGLIFVFAAAANIFGWTLVDQLPPRIRPRVARLLRLTRSTSINGPTARGYVSMVGTAKVEIQGETLQQRVDRLSDQLFEHQQLLGKLNEKIIQLDHRVDDVPEQTTAHTERRLSEVSEENQRQLGWSTAVAIFGVLLTLVGQILATWPG